MQKYFTIFEDLFNGSTISIEFVFTAVEVDTCFKEANCLRAHKSLFDINVCYIALHIYSILSFHSLSEPTNVQNVLCFRVLQLNEICETFTVQKNVLGWTEITVAGWCETLIQSFPNCLLTSVSKRALVHKRSCEKDLICKTMNVQEKPVSIWKTVHQDSFWNRGKSNSEMAYSMLRIK